MKNFYKFLTSVKGPLKGKDNKGKIMDAVVVKVFAETKEEAMKKVMRIAETKHCFLQEIEECYSDIDESMKHQKEIISFQKKMFAWLKKLKLA